MAKVIAITGTPGSGKTTIANKLSKRIRNSVLIRVNEVVKEKGLFSSYSKDGARIVKMRELQKELEKRVRASKGTVILEGHLLCEMKIKGATAIVIREHLARLRPRLLKRGYSTAKIRDNLVSEAIDYCGERAARNYTRTFEIISGKAAVAEILHIMGGKTPKKGELDMLSELPAIIKRDKRLAIG